jgi:hypothetical protein
MLYVTLGGRLGIAPALPPKMSARLSFDLRPHSITAGAVSLEQ